MYLSTLDFSVKGILKNEPDLSESAHSKVLLLFLYFRSWKLVSFHRVLNKSLSLKYFLLSVYLLILCLCRLPCLSSFASFSVLSLKCIVTLDSNPPLPSKSWYYQVWSCSFPPPFSHSLGNRVLWCFFP